MVARCWGDRYLANLAYSKLNGWVYGGYISWVNIDQPAAALPRSDQVLVRQEKTLQEECVQNDYV